MGLSDLTRDVGSTDIHRHPAPMNRLRSLDPRVKFAMACCLMLAAALTERLTNLLLLAAIGILLLLLSRPTGKQVVALLTGLAPLIIITILLHGVLSEDPPYLHWLTVSGMLRGTKFALKIAVLGLTFLPLLTTNHPAEWGKAGEQTARFLPFLRKPITIFCLALAFLPLLTEEAERIRHAQAGRGARQEGGMVRRIKGLATLMMPLLGSILHRADVVTVSLQTRGYSLSRPRTITHPLKFTVADLLFFTATAIISALALWNR